MKTQSERTRLLYDTSIVGEGVPMLSASQQELQLDDVVYSGSVGVDGYDEKRKVSMDITAWRVIQLNYQDRYARIRNEQGCEMTVSFAEGCTRLKVYHDFEKLRLSLLAQISKEEYVTREKIKAREALLERLEQETKIIAKMKPPTAPVLTKKVERKGKPN